MRVVCADDAVAMWWGPNAQSAIEIDIFSSARVGRSGERWSCCKRIVQYSAGCGEREAQVL
jgi:hypothetical protein